MTIRSRLATGVALLTLLVVLVVRSRRES